MYRFILAALVLTTPVLASAQSQLTSDPAPVDAPAADDLDAIHTGMWLGFKPQVLPAGVTVRVHQPVGDYADVFVGVGAAAALTSFETQPIRLEVESGADYFLGKRYDSPFVGARIGYAHWTAVPTLGGTNLHGGLVGGQTAPLGDHGATVTATGGLQLHGYTGDYNGLGDYGDGYQVLPHFELEFTLPTIH